MNMQEFGLNIAYILAEAEGDILLFNNLFERHTSDDLFLALQKEIDWQRDIIRIFGREIPAPRLSAWYGDPGVRYRYSGISLTAVGWTDTLLRIKSRVEEVAGLAFNSVLLNLYRDGADGMSWHSDDEHELGINPVIASFSLGAARRFQFKHKQRRDRARIEVTLEHGSLLLMRGAIQHYWKHCLPKTRRPTAPRINLTFRTIKTPVCQPI